MTVLSRFSQRCVGWIPIVLAACGGRPSAPVPVHPPDTARVDTPVVAVVDTESTIWPDPVHRTWARLESVQHLIAQFEKATGRLPERLDEVLPTESAPAAMRVDAWGNPLRYDVAGTSYTITAAGPDRAFGTADDLQGGPDTRPPQRTVDPVRLTQGVLSSFELAVQAFRSRYGAFPENISALGAAGIKPLLGERDGWGNAIVYTRRADGIELRSSGPDGIRGNEDDIVLMSTQVWQYLDPAPGESTREPARPIRAGSFRRSGGLSSPLGVPPCTARPPAAPNLPVTKKHPM